MSGEAYRRNSRRPAALRIAMTRLPILTAALAALLLVPAAAPAAPPWSAPATVGQGAPYVGAPEVLYGETGGQVLWTGAPGALYAAPLGPGGRPQAPAAVAGAGDGVALPSFAAGRRFVLTHVRYSADRPPVLRAGTANGPGERFALQRLYARRGGLMTAIADADRAGAVVIGTRPAGARSRGRVHLALRAGTSRRYRAPFPVSRRGSIWKVAVAANDRGDVLVVWERSHRVEARFRYASGRLGPVLRLGRTRSAARQLHVSLKDDRRAVVAWLDQHVSEGEATARARILATARGPRSPFRPATLLEEFPDGEVAGGAVRTAIAGNWGMVAWTGRRAARVSIATGGTFDPPQDLGPLPDRTYDRGGGLSDLEATPEGKALAVWIEPSVTTFGGAVRAALLSGDAGPAFGPAEAVSPPAELVATPSAAFDPLDNTAVVAWREPASARGGRDRLLLATRPAP